MRKGRRLDEAGSPQWGGGGGHEQMLLHAGVSLGGLGGLGSVTQGVMSCWQCRALHLELDTRHVLGYSLQSTAVSQMAFVTHSQSLPSCFEKLLQLRNFWKEIQ